jgi:hypothetical protein
MWMKKKKVEEDALESSQTKERDTSMEKAEEVVAEAIQIGKMAEKRRAEAAGLDEGLTFDENDLDIEGLFDGLSGGSYNFGQIMKGLCDREKRIKVEDFGDGSTSGIVIKTEADVNPPEFTDESKTKKEGGFESDHKAEDGKKPSVGLMDLKEELRERIWKHAVVQDECVKPDDREDQEQPDLAMTCRSIRNEVLGIYYKESWFKVEVKHLLRANGKAAKAMRAPTLCEKWLKAMRKAGHLSLVRNWIFEYYHCGKFVYVTMKLVKAEDGTWGADVQVHACAACVIPGSKHYNSCMVKTSPEWLNEAVIEMLDQAKGGDISGGMICELAREIDDGVDELAGAVCSWCD